MSSTVPLIISCTDSQDIEGVKKCIQDGCNIDEQRAVMIVYEYDSKGWKISVARGMFEGLSRNCEAFS